jgi:hypothetical protein
LFPFPTIPPSGAYAPWSFYTVPVIASAGPNGAVPNVPYGGFNLDAYMGVFDPTAANVHVGDDNIYSYRLRLGARGD